MTKRDQEVLTALENRQRQKLIVELRSNGSLFRAVVTGEVVINEAAAFTTFREPERFPNCAPQNAEVHSNSPKSAPHFQAVFGRLRALKTQTSVPSVPENPHCSVQSAQPVVPYLSIPMPQADQKTAPVAPLEQGLNLQALQDVSQGWADFVYSDCTYGDLLNLIEWLQAVSLAQPKG